MDNVLRKWDLPYSNTGIPAGSDTKEMWSKALRESFTQQHRFHPRLRLTENKIRQLVEDYWKGNPDTVGVQVNMHVNFATAGPHPMLF